MSQEKAVCQFFRVGYCKYKTMCKLLHVKEECMSENCSSESCVKRHRKPCFYWKKFGNCKIGNKCEYKHDKRDDIKDLENKIDDLVAKNNAKDAIIEKLVEDVKSLATEVKMLKDTASKLNFVGAEKSVTLEEKEGSDIIDNSAVVLNVEATVENKAKEFINRNIEHLNNMKKEVKKSKKNSKGVREKIKTFYSKMKDEVQNCDLDSESSQRHNDCCFMLPHLEDQIEKWIKTNDKDEFLEVIEEFITEFDGMLQEV